MRHLINGVPINLRELTQHEIDALTNMVEERIESAQDDLEKIKGEVIRRERFRQSLIS